MLTEVSEVHEAIDVENENEYTDAVNFIGKVCFTGNTCVISEPNRNGLNGFRNDTFNLWSNYWGLAPES